MRSELSSSSTMMMPPPPPPPANNNIGNRRIQFASSQKEEDNENHPTTTTTSKVQADGPYGNNLKRKQGAEKNSRDKEETFEPTTTYTTSSSKPNTTLTHLQTNWPGQKGKGRQHLKVLPMRLMDLLSTQNQRITIPLFQRRYCWTLEQIQQWWYDVSKSIGQHSTHKTMFKRNADDNKDELICIDGQQRLTTATLFLMVLRAETRRFCDPNNSSSLIHKIDAILFPNGDAIAGLKRWAKYRAFQLVRNQAPPPQGNDDETSVRKFTMPKVPDGWLPPFGTTLTPSYIDRSAYYEILCHDYILEAMQDQLQQQQQQEPTPPQVQLEFNPTCKESTQFVAYRYFATQLRGLLTKAVATHTHSTPAIDVGIIASSKLEQLYRKQLVGFSIMYMELLNPNDNNLQQIFLWMQEKTIFGMGRLLYNPHPGVDFQPIDLARNLVLSSVMNEPLEQQVQFYKTTWIEPLECRFGTHGTSRILYQLVKQFDHQQQPNLKNRYNGDTETKLQEYKATAPAQFQESCFGHDKPMMVYGRFHSYVQQRAIQLEKGNPNAITPQVANRIVQEMVAVGKSMGL